MLRIEHPSAHLLAPAAGFQAQVLSGNWSAAAYLVNAHFWALGDTKSCAAALQQAFTDSGYQVETVDPVPAIVEDGAISFDADAPQVAEVIDLFTRVLIGQWQQMDWATRLNALSLGSNDLNTGDHLNQIRTAYQRSGAYPDHPRASWGVHSEYAPAAAHLGYAAWKALGGGMKERPTVAFEGVLPTISQTSAV